VNTCVHLDRVHDVTPSGDGCVECLETGDRWVHLRLCMTCGHVGCCDSSPNKHASRHHAATAHPVVRSFEPGESWGYCFEDDAWVERL
jgi:CPA2 family monovalent cation:H+ antiporter-2